MINKLLRLIKNPKRIVSALASRGLLNWLSDETVLKMQFKTKMGEKLNLENPKTFNEKLQWLKLYDRNPVYTELVDKYEVRKYISETIGDEYLIPLIGIWNKFEKIDFSKLPNQFVLKCTHDSGGLIICTDKSKLDIEAARKKINRCLKRNHYHAGREWPYKNVKPRIICEKYMVDESGGEIEDYKFMCFNGKVKCIFVCLNRNSSERLNIDIYDTNWNLMPFERPNSSNSRTMIPKPKNFDKMIEFAEKLSEDKPFVRVDFYEINGQLYFGEITFYPSAGFEKFKPESYDYLLGNWLGLPISGVSIKVTN
ncbi:glycosyl transferase [Anaerosalibacter massiliensis]|uniref:Glycosyl transferase n=1 Tax=Anaerosalibacter massiliensis TaxID=1347392 RepID=A0A9X2MLB7_9FIRM|nr:ATP-grasp fold amidoligase family protein [Anaerosalibacter massiliensis]MCR2045596.1 glycosyl transferase [Anaerosalibacter massiliensis]